MIYGTVFAFSTDVSVLKCIILYTQYQYTKKCIVGKLIHSAVQQQNVSGRRTVRRGTHPYIVLLPVLLPDSARVTEQEHVAADPVGAAVSALSGHRRHLHPVPQVHLQPRVPVSQLRAPPTSSCKHR